MTAVQNSLTGIPRAWAEMVNGSCLKREAIPVVSYETFSSQISEGVASGKRITALFGIPGCNSQLQQLCVILADDEQNKLFTCMAVLPDDSCLSITPGCPQAHLFEREIAEQYGIRFAGHPWFKPVRYHHSWSRSDAWGRLAAEAIIPGAGDFFAITGEAIHEVAVGPVHAGIIEPGHFRFQCHGEKVYHLEIALGYQHRGIEKKLLNGPDRRTLHYMENASGDTAIGHTTVYSRNVESLSGASQLPRSQVIRGVALELERLANHIGDLGALAMDVGFLPTSSYCGRIRGDVLNMTAVLCGSRFGRNLVKPGGVRFDIGQAEIDDLRKRLDEVIKDTTVAITLLWDTQSAMARFEGVGALSESMARELGLVGPAARATGLVRDVRYDHASGIYCFAHLPVATCTSGDVFARAYVRWIEIQQSFKFIGEQLSSLPRGSVYQPCGALQPDSIAVSLEEGWRGEICHVALTDANGRFMRYKIVDPSFHNWTGLAIALRNQQISDFPICNKSFNLSYCGHDL